MKDKNSPFTSLTVFLSVVFFVTVPVSDIGMAIQKKADRQVFRHIPPGSETIEYDSNLYMFYKGGFYKPAKGGYVCVRPPKGTVVRRLPAEVTQVMISGTAYYIYNGIYYKKVETGYQVLELPAPVPQLNKILTATKAVPGARALVLVASLNVRTGPGKNHEIISQVGFGSMLIIQVDAMEWIYVRLPDGRNGWVMRKFVALSVAGSHG